MYVECRPINEQDLQVLRGDTDPHFSPLYVTRVLRILWCLRFALLAVVVALLVAVIYEMANAASTFADQARKRAAQNRRIRQPLQRRQLQTRYHHRVRRRGPSAV